MPEMAVEANDNQLRLRFPEGWLDAHPLTQADLESEAEYLKAIDFKLKCK